MNLSALSERLPRLLNTGLAALKAPSANPTTALITIGVVALAALIVVLLGAVLVTLIGDIVRPEPEPEEDDSADEVEERAVRPAWIGRTVWTVAAVLALGAVFLGYDYSTRDTTCARCHFTAAAFKSRTTDASHSKVACRSCHVTPGVGGSLSAVVTGAGNLRAQLSGTEPTRGPVAADVTNAACLSCHADVLEGVGTSRNTRMRHSDVLAVGYACTDCHNTAGHGERVQRPKRPEMSQCITCHDGTTAKSACETCHTSDVGLASRTPSDTSYVKVRLEVRDCRGCHSMQKCINCHGVELPHSQEFINGYHAKKAIQQPGTCLKCHTVESTCNNCHSFGVSKTGLPLAPHGHERDFVKWHAGTATNAGKAIAAVQPGLSCVCHGGTQQFCLYCHGKQPEH